jgi:hypothetical protein
MIFPKIWKNMILWRKIVITTGTGPGFQVRGGALKIIAPSGGRREHFWGISYEKSRFYAKKSYFFQSKNRKYINISVNMRTEALVAG